MTSCHIVNPYELIKKAVDDASPDLLRNLPQATINMLLSAGADQVEGAEYGAPTTGRIAQRNEFRSSTPLSKSASDPIYSRATDPGYNPR